jgi:hypothetical protein
MESFWEKGPEVYAKALGEEFEVAQTRLMTQMRECATAVRRQALEEELKALKKDYEDRLRSIGWSLF